jgi:serine/threonine-protein kinase
MPAMKTRVSLPKRYRIVRHIANGGMASVWEAEDEVLGRPVAVKVLSAGFAAHETAAERFQREARASARVSDHSNVVTIYDIGEHDGHPFIVMEYLSGGTVAERLRARGRIDRDLALRWVAEAAAALDAAHAAGIVHRDVKPANLLLDENDRLAVADFGIATLAAEATLTQTGDVIGTAAYLSPEQALGRTATPASDRYALAVVAYELLTGQRPFVRETPAAQLLAHVDAEPTPASRASRGLPAAVDEVLGRGLAKKPGDRPATARGFAADLDQAVRTGVAPDQATRALTILPMTVPLRDIGRTVTAPLRAARLGGPDSAPAAATVAADRRTRGVTRPSARPKRRRRRLAVAAVLLALCGAGVAGLTGWDRTPGGAGTSQAAPLTTPNDYNNLGYEKFKAGDPAGAVPLLQEAVNRFRASGRTDDIVYAYALFNLAQALRQIGQPAAAIPYLEERLRISDFKRDDVQAALEEARVEAGLTKPSDEHGGKHKHHGDD